MKALFVLMFAMLTMNAALANAVGFSCPRPEQVRCVPTVTTIGDWTHNGGQMTGNTFAPNNQCANVISLPSGETRLMCCYTKCGVFYNDVKFRGCQKTSQSTFLCN